MLFLAEREGIERAEGIMIRALAAANHPDVDKALAKQAEKRRQRDDRDAQLKRTATGKL